MCMPRQRPFPSPELTWWVINSYWGWHDVFIWGLLGLLLKKLRLIVKLIFSKRHMAPGNEKSLCRRQSIKLGRSFVLQWWGIRRESVCKRGYTHLAFTWKIGCQGFFKIPARWEKIRALDWGDATSWDSIFHASTWGEKTLQFLSLFQTAPADQQVIDVAGRIYRDWNPGHGVDIHDAILAATAMVTGGKIYTLNAKRYPIPDIVVEKAWIT